MAPRNEAANSTHPAWPRSATAAPSVGTSTAPPARGYSAKSATVSVPG